MAKMLSELAIATIALLQPYKHLLKTITTDNDKKSHIISAQAKH